MFNQVKPVQICESIWCQFHKHFMCSFYVRRSQRQSRHQYLFVLFGSMNVKASCKTLMKLTTPVLLDIFSGWWIWIVERIHFGSSVHDHRIQSGKDQRSTSCLSKVNRQRAKVNCIGVQTYFSPNVGKFRNFGTGVKWLHSKDRVGESPAGLGQAC